MVCRHFARSILSLGLALAVSGVAQAGIVSWAAEASSAPVREDFSAYDGGVAFAATPQSIAGNGASVSGIFAGQTPGSATAGSVTWETVGVGGAINPLTLVGQPDSPVDVPQNILFLFGAVAGMLDGGLTGAVSFLFGSDVTFFGIDVGGSETSPGSGDPGPATFAFYGRDGSLIDQITVSAVRDGPYAFDAGGRVIAGVTITNLDPYGLTYDNLRFAPAPPVLALVVVGLVGIGSMSRLRSRAAHQGAD